MATVREPSPRRRTAPASPSAPDHGEAPGTRPVPPLLSAPRLGPVRPAPLSPTPCRDPEAETMRWTAISLLIALCGLFGVIALPDGESAQARERVLDREQGLGLVTALARVRREIVAHHATAGQWPRSGEGAGLELALPTNPVNGLSTLRVLLPGESLPPAADGRSGWILDPRTGELRANARGRLLADGPDLYDL